MTDEDALTLLDFWPFAALIALAVIAFVLVFRGLRRKADDSHNRASGGGAGFQGRDGRW